MTHGKSEDVKAELDMLREHYLKLDTYIDKLSWRMSVALGMDGVSVADANDKLTQLIAERDEWRSRALQAEAGQEHWRIRATRAESETLETES